MARKKLEALINLTISKHVESFGFKLIKEDFSSKFNHLVTFEYTTGDFKIDLEIRYMKPNYLKTQVQLKIYFFKINEILKPIFPAYLPNGIPTINLDIDDYLKANGKLMEADYHLQIDDDNGYTNVNYELKASEIVKRYFICVIKDILPKIDSHSKLFNTINEADLFIGNDIKLSPLCFPIQFQICSGLALCAIIDDKNNPQLIEKYMDYMNTEFKEGEDELIDNLKREIKTLYSKSYKNNV
ncbi:hypothetical protein QLS71_011275 [Mariniflexile litorale]|uniref:DUF4304 domain-containing protein n=1 Tax=Mariniflexile litorale TaxID=3045158 RepID=A0AAU7ECN0_9FLAO|nr:hypothetical protein [Mariniflexile sp. KMM 9835]MDQ8212645.1 hypothetical protein [Mariniflexile sp. KMM 9835]